jgi:signal transduction histidine kinase
MEEYQKLRQLVEEVADDVYKAVGGNKAAGTRVRKIMQDIKNTAQDVRKKILDLRGEEETPPTSSTPGSEAGA